MVISTIAPPYLSVMDEEATLIQNAVQLVERIIQRPIDRLLPHADNIRRLNLAAASLYQPLAYYSRLSCEGHETAIVLNPTEFTGSVVTFLPPATPNAMLTRPLKTVKSRLISASDALSAAHKTAGYLGATILEHFILDEQNWLETACDQRTSHLQPIFNLQKAVASVRSDARDRLLLACSCHSLARDFQLFEQSRGWTSKEELITQRLLEGSDPAIHQYAKHHQNFLAWLNRNDIHRDKLDAGLRLGTKLRVIEVLGQESQLGCGLSLLLGFECHKLSRLPYRELSIITQHLRNRAAALELRTVNFCNQFNAWWRDVNNRYHALYGGYLSISVRSTSN